MERESPPFRGVAVEVRFNDQADKDPMCSYTSMSTCQAAWQSLQLVRSSSSLAALVVEQAPCLLTLEDHSPLLLKQDMSRFCRDTVSRHNVVAPIPVAPLLTDTRRSTVGQVRVRTS